MKINHQDNFGTNITSNQSSGVTTTPLNAIPFIQPPFWIALDATNINGKYEPVLVTSKTATNINHSATLYPHTTAEEVRMVVPSAEFDDISSSMTDGWVGIIGTLTAATATTINTSVDLTSVIQKGDKLKLINSSSTKYFYVVSLTSTVITVTGEVDLVAGAITSPQYSKLWNPQGMKNAVNEYKVFASRASAQNVADGVTTKVQFENEVFDINSNYDNTTNYRYTAPITGYYQISSYGTGTSATGRLVAVTTFLYTNGVPTLGDAIYPKNGFGESATLSNSLHALQKLSKGDYIEIFINCDSADSTVTNVINSRFDVQFISI